MIGGFGRGRRAVACAVAAGLLPRKKAPMGSGTQGGEEEPSALSKEVECAAPGSLVCSWWRGCLAEWCAGTQRRLPQGEHRDREGRAAPAW